MRNIGIIKLLSMRINLISFMPGIHMQMLHSIFWRSRSN
jgi:hypothetical protein